MRPSLVTSILAVTFPLLACQKPSPPPGPREPASASSPVSFPTSLASTTPKPIETSSVSTQNAKPSMPPSTEAVEKLASGSNTFGFDLYRRLQKTPGNIVFSPASITSALSMTWVGAKGTTADQMKKVLHFDGSPDEVMKTSGQLAAALEDPKRPITFRIANRLFGEATYRFEQGFMDKVGAAFGAPLERVDFRGGAEAARARINGWVEERTEKRIRDLIPQNGVDGDTRLALVNAIYFYGDWASPFDKSRTRPESFQLSKDSKKDVATMHGSETHRYAHKDGVSILELPYKGGQMSSLILLPDSVDGLGSLESSLDHAKLQAMVKELKSERVEMAIPKFELAPSTSLSIGGELVALGMKAAFERKKADFTGIANPPKEEDRLFISKVFHKAFVKVDEKGTEAAAATAAVMAVAGAAPMEPKRFHADHPFLFVIRDNTSGLVLFMGRVADPSG